MNYKYNKNAFNTIKTEEDAYWLGFLLADGYISNCDIQQPLVQIKLGAKDLTHLQKFCTYMQYNSFDVIKKTTGGAYTKDNICYVVKIGCKQLSLNLKQYGLCGAKSGKEQPYILNDTKLETAYIRGILDGDGWICSTRTGFGCCGSYETMQYIKDFIQTNITDVSQNHITEHGTIYRFEVHNTEKTKKILDYFYKDANIYLDRKYQLYLEQYN